MLFEFICVLLSLFFFFFPFLNKHVLPKKNKKTVHLGHTVSTTDRDCITMAAKNNFWKNNIFIANFGQLYCCIKIKLFNQFCCSFYGSLLWNLNGAAEHSLCVAWRKSLRSL